MGDNADWMEDKASARRKGKDSVFIDLFHIPANAVEMVKALSPGLEVTEEDIEFVTLHSVLMVRPYNDLGLLVKDKMFFCSEAQSTWSLNVLVRMFLYLAETYNRYIQKHKEMNIYGTKKIPIPKPACFVIYTGDKKNLPEFLQLAEEFFAGDSALDLKVKVLATPGTTDIVQQYIRFCHLFDEQVKVHGKTKLAIEETIRLCRDENVLAKYLAEREGEVEDIMMTLLSQEEVNERYGNECREEGRIEGRTEGREENMLSSIHNLMDTMNFTVEKAMDALKVPMEDRERYASAIKAM